MVRIGPREDGGYVLPETVSVDTRYLYSVGISIDWRFESAIASSNPRLEIRAYDRNSGSLVFFYSAIRNLLFGYVTGSDELFRARIRMSWKYFVLGLRFRMFFRFGRRFYRKWVRSVSKSSDEVAFVDSIKSIPDYGSLLIKMDIEGGEYELANDLIEEIERRKNQITCIVMEFHDTELRRTEFSTLVRNIQKHLSIVHIHGNNCAITASERQFIAGLRVQFFSLTG